MSVKTYYKFLCGLFCAIPLETSSIFQKEFPLVIPILPYSLIYLKQGNGINNICTIVDLMKLYFHRFSHHLNIMFESRPDWDRDGEYVPDKLNIYYENKTDNKLYHVEQSVTLRQVLSRNRSVKNNVYLFKMNNYNMSIFFY